MLERFKKKAIQKASSGISLSTPLLRNNRSSLNILYSRKIHLLVSLRLLFIWGKMTSMRTGLRKICRSLRVILLLSVNERSCCKQHTLGEKSYNVILRLFHGCRRGAKNPLHSPFGSLNAISPHDSKGRGTPGRCVLLE